MVNRGVSRACASCKQCRKKCDEIQPTCGRCQKNQTTCNYPHTDSFIFRNYASHPLQSASEDTSDRSCTDAPLLLTKLLPVRFNDRELISRFISDFCCKTADPSISRGYLDGLESLLLSQRPNSVLHEAIVATSLASIGFRSNELHLVNEARSRYASLLERFRTALLDAHHFDRALMTAIATILGLYELITADETLARTHNEHIRGLSAILTEPGSPFDVNRALQTFSTANALPLHSDPQHGLPVSLACHEDSKCGAFRSMMIDLDNVLLKIHPLMQKIRLLLDTPEAQLKALRTALAEASEIEQELKLWSKQQKPTGWQPVRDFNEWYGKAGNQLLSYQVQITESYYDLYVAAVWNTYRKCHLLIVDLEHSLALKLSDTSGSSVVNHREVARYRLDAEELSDLIFASISFHFGTGLPTHRSDPNHWHRPVGGLLMIHPLLVVSRCSILDAGARDQARNILGWIGSDMGIGEAGVLARTDDPVPFDDAACGHVLIWSGMMI